MTCSTCLLAEGSTIGHTIGTRGRSLVRSVLSRHVVMEVGIVVVVEEESWIRLKGCQRIYNGSGDSGCQDNDC